jgi:hypothetical protein
VGREGERERRIVNSQKKMNVADLIILAAGVSVSGFLVYSSILAVGAIKDADKAADGITSPSLPPSPPFNPPLPPPPPSPPPPSPPPPLPPPAARRELETVKTHFALRDDERKLLAKAAARLR